MTMPAIAPEESDDDDTLKTLLQSIAEQHGLEELEITWQ
jgi:hypothetical protein